MRRQSEQQCTDQQKTACYCHVFVSGNSVLCQHLSEPEASATVSVADASGSDTESASLALQIIAFGGGAARADGAGLPPLPAGDFGHVVAVAVDVLFVLDQLFVNGL